LASIRLQILPVKHSYLGKLFHSPNCFLKLLLKNVHVCSAHWQKNLSSCRPQFESGISFWVDKIFAVKVNNEI
jgi:hypothetical protein